MTIPSDTVDGPPPTPFQRARQRRRRLVVAAVVGALVLLGVFAVFVIFEPQPTEEGLAAEDDVTDEQPEAPEAPEAPEEEEEVEEFVPPEIELDLDDDGRPDTEVPEDDLVQPPAVEELQGRERSLAELLLDIDAAERAMLGFQFAVQAAHDPDRGSGGADEVEDEIRVAALQAIDALAVLRQRMEEPLEDSPGDLPIEQVRDTYVVHLDSWVRWLEAIADDPGSLNDQTGWFTIDINRTASAFVRAVDEALSDDLDAEVVRFAEGILDRGFPPPEDSPV